MDEATEAPNPDALAILERLGMADVMATFGISVVPRLALHSFQRDPESLEDAVYAELEPLEVAIHALEKTLDDDQRRQLETVIARFCAVALACGRPFIEERENRAKGWHKSRKAQARYEAWLIAQEKWRTDPDMRMGEMANYVWSALVDAGYADERPTNVAALRDWLTDAPESASRRGRPRSKK